MQPQRPVYWYSGQFLEPQHFQQADAFHVSERTALIEAAQPFFWGVGELNVDTTALAEGEIIIRSMKLRFQDGTEAVIADILENGNTILPSRNYREAWQDLNTPFTVFVGLPPLKPSGNVAGIPDCKRDKGNLIAYDTETLPGASGRYLCPNTDDSIADRYALPLAVESPGNAPVRTLYLYPRLFWENEIISHPDWLFLPLLRLTDDGSGPRPDSEYTPACLTVTASPALLGLVRGLETRLAATVRRLEPARLRAFDEPVTTGQLLLVNAARTLSELRHALVWPGTHPQDLFGLLRHGLTALAACVGVSVTNALLPYQHGNPAACFLSLDKLLQNIVCDLFPKPAAVIHFNVEGDFLRADLPDDAGRARPLLVVQTDESTAALLDEGRLVVDAPNTLPHTLTQAVAGVPLHEVPTPPGLLQRKGLRYLEPDVHSAGWQAVVRAGAIGVAFFPLQEVALPEHLRLLYLRD